MVSLKGAKLSSDTHNRTAPMKSPSSILVDTREASCISGSRVFRLGIFGLALGKYGVGSTSSFMWEFTMVAKETWLAPLAGALKARVPKRRRRSHDAKLFVATTDDNMDASLVAPWSLAARGIHLSSLKGVLAEENISESDGDIEGGGSFQNRPG